MSRAVFGKPVKLSKAECYAICARLPNKVPDCPYMQFPCRKFYLNLGSGICFEYDVKCCWEPSWIVGSVVNRFAVLKKDGCLHV